MKKIISIILLGCLFTSLIGCGTSTTENSSASVEQTSTVNESVSSVEEPQVVDTRLTKEIIMEYVDNNKSSLWKYEEDKYSDDLTIWVSFDNMDEETRKNAWYNAPSNYWSVVFIPNLYWNDKLDSLIFDPYITYTSAWFLDTLSPYDEIQIATDSDHMKLVLDYTNEIYETNYSESEGFVYMTEEDIDDMKQLLEMLDDNPSVRLNPVNAEETIEFYLTDTMIMQFKETITLYLELQEIIR